MRIPLLEDALTEPLPSGSGLMTLYDGGSQWYNACITIVAGWLRDGGTVRYHVSAQPLEKIRTSLHRLNSRTEEMEKNGTLELLDWYTATLGRQSREKLAMHSLKTADLSIWWSQHEMIYPRPETHLTMIDDASCLSRFNDERVFVEFILGRIIPTATLTKSICIFGLIRQLHSDWVYRRLEAAVDGTFEFRLLEIRQDAFNAFPPTAGHRVERWGPMVEGGMFERMDAAQELIDVMRVRNMRETPFVSKWQRIKFDKNHGVTLHKDNR